MNCSRMSMNGHLKSKREKQKPVHPNKYPKKRFSVTTQRFVWQRVKRSHIKFLILILVIDHRKYRLCVGIKQKNDYTVLKETHKSTLMPRFPSEKTAFGITGRAYIVPEKNKTVNKGLCVV